MVDMHAGTFGPGVPVQGNNRLFSSDFCVGTESCEIGNLCDFFMGNSQTVSGFLVVSRHNVQLLGISHVW